ncbi:hypothetical protein BU14_1726s0001 [Porphyra umbilicalis]|uniref:Protein kinase domain-containing protein n=1 Tax=Porphyra umbilicalis TaxID=2786 RepID=A0A1X6NL19_PORUM|nr:hypothetical protein BU14_1726s0001 [Porphyra umbilicalis]|eukprot:OSX69220.1 hypothetical protein BU14_1726s0001 [Porphyra umbilicalis]
MAYNSSVLSSSSLNGDSSREWSTATPDLTDPAVLSWSPDDDALLGKGTFGEVYRCQLIGSDAAVKIVYDEKVPRRFGETSTQATKAKMQLEREVRRLSQFRYPHITQYLGAAHDGKRGCTLLVTELMAGGSLQSSLATSRRANAPLYPKTFFHIATHIALGLQYLHHFHISHGDIKPANILLTDALTVEPGRGLDGRAGLSRNAMVKLADFGMSLSLHPEPSGPINATVDGPAERGIQGTLAYLAPEGFVGGKPKSSAAAKAQDIYAMGIVLYGLLSGNEPWEGYNSHMLYGAMNDKDTVTRPKWPTRAGLQRRAASAASAAAAASSASVADSVIGSFVQSVDSTISGDVTEGRADFHRCRLGFELENSVTMTERCWAQDPADRPTADELVAFFRNEDRNCNEVDWDFGGGGGAGVFVRVETGRPARDGHMVAGTDAGGRPPGVPPGVAPPRLNVQTAGPGTAAPVATAAGGDTYYREVFGTAAPPPSAGNVEAAMSRMSMGGGGGGLPPASAAAAPGAVAAAASAWPPPAGTAHGLEEGGSTSRCRRLARAIYQTDPASAHEAIAGLADVTEDKDEALWLVSYVPAVIKRLCWALNWDLRSDACSPAVAHDVCAVLSNMAGVVATQPPSSPLATVLSSVEHAHEIVGACTNALRRYSTDDGAGGGGNERVCAAAADALSAAFARRDASEPHVGRDRVADITAVLHDALALAVARRDPDLTRAVLGATCGFVRLCEPAAREVATVGPPGREAALTLAFKAVVEIGGPTAAVAATACGPGGPVSASRVDLEGFSLLASIAFFPNLRRAVLFAGGTRMLATLLTRHRSSPTWRSAIVTALSTLLGGWGQLTINAMMRQQAIARFAADGGCEAAVQAVRLCADSSDADGADGPYGGSHTSSLSASGSGGVESGAQRPVLVRRLELLSLQVLRMLYRRDPGLLQQRVLDGGGGEAVLHMLRVRGAGLAPDAALEGVLVLKELAGHGWRADGAAAVLRDLGTAYGAVGGIGDACQEALAAVTGGTRRQSDGH